MADNVIINTQAGSGASVSSSVNTSGAVSTSVLPGSTARSTITSASSFQTTTTGASGPRGEPGQDGIFSAIASQAEAEAGTDNVKGMSPLRVAQAIAALESSDAVASVNSQTGTVVLDQDDIADGTTYKQYSATEKTKLAGVATGATANSSDATLLNRTNHTGAQAISTVTGLQTALDGKEPLKGPDDNYVTDAEKVVIGNTSGTNTGDQDVSGFVTGPASTTDNTIPRYDSTTGKIIQSSGYTIDDTDTMLTDGLINSTTIVAAPFVATDAIEEYVTDNGVTIETVLIQDGQVDGRDVSVDGTKLDGIETGATADQSAAEILTAVKTVDGTGSGLDADLLDGNEATAFAAASHTHTESEITDLDHDATKIQGVTVDNTDIANGKVLQYNSVSGNLEYETPAGGGGGSGDVTGPASSTDNAIVRFDSTTGKIIQDSTGNTIDDSGNLTTGKLLKIDNLGSGNPEFDFTESGTVRAKTYYDVTNNRLTFQNNENNNADAIYFTDHITTTGNISGVGILGATEVQAGASGITSSGNISATASTITGNILSADTVNERTPAAGVTVDGVLIKDGNVATSTAGVTLDNGDTGTGVTLVSQGTPGSSTITIPNTTTTMVGTATTQTLTNKNLSSSTNTFPDFYPVGSIYINRTNSANPSTYLPGQSGSTWVAITDKMIMGRGATYTADAGAATHTHPLSSNGHAQIFSNNPTSTTNIHFKGGAVSAWTSTHRINLNLAGNANATSISNGVDLGGATDSGSNIPPMIVAYTWERTA